MPALMTHYLFGEKSAESLPEGMLNSLTEQRAFSIGNQGPDPFFFRVRTPRVRTCAQFARVMHRSRLTRQFACLRDGIDRLPEADARVGRAFVMGLLSHYVLDRNAHPFVYAQQFGLCRADPGLEPSKNGVHAIIEADLDVHVLHRERDGATCAEVPPASVLATNPRVGLVAGLLMSDVARTVYDLPVGASEYAGACADMELCYKVIEPAGSPRGRALAALERLFDQQALLSSLAHPVTRDEPVAAANPDRRPWTDPFTGQEHRESFDDVFDRALADYAECAARFLAGGDLAAMTRHVNYSGRPLGPDEEFDREE